MARVETVVTMCDLCGSEKEARRYEVKAGAKRRSLDLCAKHSAPLRKLLDRQTTPLLPARETGVQRRPRRKKVMTMDEIEALKEE